MELLMKLSLLICTAFLVTSGYNCAFAATVYKKTNSDGSISYADLPFTGAVAAEVKLKNVTPLPALTTAPNASAPVSSSLQSAVTQNHAITIATPQHQQTVRANDGRLTVMVQTTAPPSNKITIQLFINNSPYGQPSQNTVFEVKNIDRGEVRIKAQLLNKLGNILATSPETVVYLHRATVKRTN